MVALIHEHLIVQLAKDEFSGREMEKFPLGRYPTHLGQWVFDSISRFSTVPQQNGQDVRGHVCSAEQWSTLLNEISSVGLQELIQVVATWQERSFDLLVRDEARCTSWVTNRVPLPKSTERLLDRIGRTLGIRLDLQMASKLSAGEPSKALPFLLLAFKMQG